MFFEANSAIMYHFSDLSLLCYGGSQPKDIITVACTRLTAAHSIQIHQFFPHSFTYQHFDWMYIIFSYQTQVLFEVWSRKIHNRVKYSKFEHCVEPGLPFWGKWPIFWTKTNIGHAIGIVAYMSKKLELWPIDYAVFILFDHTGAPRYLLSFDWHQSYVCMTSYYSYNIKSDSKKKWLLFWTGLQIPINLCS